MNYHIGFDVGSTTIKAVVIDDKGNICYKSYERHFSKVRQKALDKLYELKIIDYKFKCMLLEAYQMRNAITHKSIEDFLKSVEIDIKEKK